MRRRDEDENENGDRETEWGEMEMGRDGNGKMGKAYNK